MRLTKLFTITFSAFSLALIAFSILVFTRSTSPFIGFAGGALEGQAREAPADWAWTTPIATVQLETSQAGDPYSVNLWGVGLGPNFYVGTRPEGTVWSANLDADPNVRLLIGPDLYALRAVKVDEDAEFQNVVSAYAEKYDTERAEMASTLGIIYRLDARR